MRLIRQPTDYTCGQSCIAMISGTPIGEVRKITKSGWNKRHWFGEKTSTSDLVRALRVLGIRSRRKLRRKIEGTSLPKTCIAKLCITGVRWGHWVVVHENRILDPYYGINPCWPKGTHITSYLEIL